MRHNNKLLKLKTFVITYRMKKKQKDMKRRNGKEGYGLRKKW